MTIKRNKDGHDTKDKTDCTKPNKNGNVKQKLVSVFFLIAIINDQEYLNLGLNTNLNKI